MHNPIEQFLLEVTESLGKEVDARILQEALAEMRSHLDDSAAGFVELGEERSEAERQAVLAFGNVKMASEVVPNEPLIDRSYVRWLVPSLIFGTIAILPIIVWMLVQIGVAPRDVLRSEIPGAVLLLGGVALLFLSSKNRQIAVPQILLGLVTCWIAMSATLASSVYREPIFNQIVGKDVFVSQYKSYFADLPKYEAAFSWNNETIRQFQIGEGQAFLLATKNTDGYAQPISRSDAISGQRRYSLDFGAVSNGWQQTADRISLAERVRLHEWQVSNEVAGWVKGYQANQFERTLWILNSTKEFLLWSTLWVLGAHVVGVGIGRRRRRRSRSTSNATNV